MIVRRFQFTPENIQDLRPDEVFVFGSNEAGAHAGGAARVAWEKFGAIWGQGRGLQGQSYALPTLDENLQCLTIGQVRSNIREFLRTVDQYRGQKVFLLTKVGCGIAGFRISQIASAFWDESRTYYGDDWFPYVGCLPENLVIPEEFYDYMPRDLRSSAVFNRINSDLLFIERQIVALKQKATAATDPEGREAIHDSLRDAESQRNILKEELQDFIREVI